MKQEEIGSIAGMIWHALDAKGDLSLAQLKKEVNGKTPVFDWAVGWLAREEKIVGVSCGSVSMISTSGAS